MVVITGATTCTDTEALRGLVVATLAELGFDLQDSGQPDWTQAAGVSPEKAFLRSLHEPARRAELTLRQAWLRRRLPTYLAFFANGHDIQPDRIAPALIPVAERWQEDLFRIGRLLWSLPYSKGYGRRLRFLILDSANDKLIGLLGLQSPPLSFPARDRLFDYPPGKKTHLVNQTMDIYTLGAVPPYDRLLGGKLIALAAASDEIREAYRAKYLQRPTLIERRVLPAELVALTTTSAFGRSSLYNRLSFRGQAVAISLGYTDGYGSFHLSRLYPHFRQFLESRGISTRGGFGAGPRITWQTMVRALQRIGFSKNLLRHGVPREAFLFPLIENLKDYLEGRTTLAQYRCIPFNEASTWWRERWLIGRAERVDGWRHWSNQALLPRLLLPVEERLS